MLFILLQIDESGLIVSAALDTCVTTCILSTPSILSLFYLVP